MGSALATQCAEITSFDSGSTAQYYETNGAATDLAANGVPLAKYHVMKYKLYDASGVKESNERSAIVVVPTVVPGANPGPWPLIMYAHDYGFGLAYQEISAVFSKTQASFVIAAPTYPGEPLCGQIAPGSLSCASGTPLAAAVGTQSYYDWDVNELLGLHNCVQRYLGEAAATSGSNPFVGKVTQYFTPTDLTAIATATALGAGATPEQLAAAQAAQAKMDAIDGLHYQYYQTSNPGQFAFPVKTVVSGVGRGALVAQLAVARSGIYVADLGSKSATVTPQLDTLVAASQWAAAKGSSTRFIPMLAEGLATIGSPSSLTVGQSRAYLEMMVKGQAAHTTFYSVPGVAGLAPLLSQIGAGTMSAANGAIEIALRDMTYMFKYTAGGLREWQGSAVSKVKGHILMLHGTEDKLFPFTDSFLAYNLYLNTANTLAGLGANAPAPGFYVGLYGFQPPESSYTNGKFTGTDYNHGTAATFFTGKLRTLTTSQKALIGGTASPASTDTAGLKAQGVAAGLKSSLGPILFPSVTDGNQLAVSLGSFAYPYYKPADVSSSDNQLKAEAAAAMVTTKANESDLTAVTPLELFAIWLYSETGSAEALN
jgi:hypothetical protein